MIYKSEALSALHETMKGAYDAGLLDKKTMREFDEGCLIDQPPNPDRVSLLGNQTNCLTGGRRPADPIRE